MKTIPVAASRPYEVIIQNQILAETGRLLCAVKRPMRAHIVTDDVVAPLYLQTVKTSLQNENIAVSTTVMPNGEPSKNGRQLFAVLEDAAQSGLRRGDVFVALGGGVVGDLCGLAAAMYLRGIDFVMLPTTLLSAVDSSVGGKTAVDLEHGKNLAGAFHQPILVLCDPAAFETLPPRQVANGMAEIIKYGMICDPDLLAVLEQGTDGRMADVVARCVAIKAGIVARDEFDTGERRLLNFGHTLGHAVELSQDFLLQHGEAVALGMELITAACAAAGSCPGEVHEKLHALLKKYGLIIRCDLSADVLMHYAALDKKSEADRITLVLPQAYGRCVLKKCSFDELAALTERGLRAL
ncbi:MAG: 3-dehydroquinate synthase [Clostridia bacterium]|nr:3-dehydroquinate synthase [Clostridia bacterium]